MRKRLWVCAAAWVLAGCGGGGGKKSSSVEIVSPGALSYTNGTIAIEVETRGGSGPVRLYRDGTIVLADLPSPPYVYAWDTTSVIEGTHTIEASFKGERSAGVAVVIDRTAPRVIERYPGHGADDAAADGAIRVRFSEPLGTDSSITTSVALDAGGVAVPATLSSVGLDLSITPVDPLPAPATAHVVLSPAGGTSLRDRAGNPLAMDEWTFEVPVWQPLSDRLDVEPGAAAYGSVVAVDSQGRTVVAWYETTDDPYVYPGAVYHLYVRRWNGASWDPLGSVVNVNTACSIILVSLAIDASDRPIVAFYEEQDPGVNSGDVYVRRWEGSAWQTLGSGPLDITASDDSRQTALAIAPDGQPTVSFLSIGGTTTMHVFHWSGTAWQEYGTGLPVTYFWAPNALAVAPDGLPVVAHVDVSGDLRVARWNGAAWANAGGPIEAVAGTTTAAPALVVDADDAPIVAWHEVDPAPIGGRENVYVARFDAVGGSWSRLGDSLDAYLPHRAWYPDLALAADGVSPVVGWTEYDGLHSDGYAARWTGTHWRHAGGELGGDGIVNVVAVAVDPLSDRTIASWNDYGVPEYGDADVHVARFNADFETLSGLPGALENANCLDAFPTGAPPATLAGIGCFVGSPTPNAAAAGLVPYDLNSPLWSDDALKRRWLLLPPAGEIGWEAASAWTFPDGTLFFKEFALERVKGDPGTRFPIETRVLVIRDAATVEGYSYKWRDDGSNADLLPDAPLLDSYEYFDAGVLVVDTHTFPSRAQCNACHSAIAGFILGPTTPNMNRPFDYGHTVENQLRAFQSAGLFGASLPAGQDDPGTLESQPRTLEMAQPLEARAKSYFAANCAHCHRVGGVTSALFEWERTLPNMAICDDIVPADPVNSFLYQRIVAVPGGAPSPMPPLARREVDPIAESVVFDWISAMSACP